MHRHEGRADFAQIVRRSAMYELIQLTEQTYYIKSPANIGLVRLEGQ